MAPLRIRLPLALLAVAVLGLSSGGCARREMVELSGNVTLDGAPLADGVIRFEPTGNAGPSAGAVIRAGAYQLLLRPGSKVVRIEGFKTVGQRPFNPGDPNSAMIPTKESIVPDRYNGESTLRCEIGPAGGRQDFELTTGN